MLFGHSKGSGLGPNRSPKAISFVQFEMSPQKVGKFLNLFASSLGMFDVFANIHVFSLIFKFSAHELFGS
jgi:hypothetical protein